jgi:hypothetical protein
MSLDAPVMYGALNVLGLADMQAGQMRGRNRRGQQASGSWCALNFWRCRQAHCLLTGSGWLPLALFAVAEAGLGHSLIGGDEQLVFLGILAIGLVFEGIWYLMHRTNAVTPAQTEPARWSAAQRPNKGGL